MRLERIWVDPKFKKKLKREAVEKDMSVLELTRVLSDDLGSPSKKKNGKFRFKI